MLTLYLCLLFSILTQSHTFHLPSPQNLQLPTQNHTSLTAGNFKPWPPAPFRFPLSASLRLYVTIKAYGPPGPYNPFAIRLLEKITQQISAAGDSYDRIKDHTERAAGIVGTFTAVGDEGGISRLQASTVLARIWGLTIVHGAVGLRDCEMEMAGKVVERFELEYRFD